MDFALLPPEVNSALIYAGPGSGPLLAAAAAWDSVAAELESTAGGYATEVSGLAGQSWFGPSSVAMAAAATSYADWLSAAAAAAGQTAAQAYGAAAAYEAAFAATVPPPLVAANRALLASLVATNFFGQNTPAIAATEAQYAAMWVQDATAMYTYAADSSAASTLGSFSEPPQTTNQSGQDAQARAAAQTVGNATSSRTQSVAQLSSTNTAQQAGSTIPGDPPIPEGSTTTVPAGSTLTVGPGSVAYINSGSVTIATTSSDGSVYFGSATSIIVNAGSAVTLGTEAVGADGVLYQAGATVAAGANPLTLTPVEAFPDVVAYLISGSAVITGNPVADTTGIVNLSSSSITAVVGSSAASITNATGSVGYVAAAPAASSGAVPGLGLLTSSPGLAGTSGIQPQLDVEGLLEWAGTLSGTELAGAIG